MDFNYWQWLIVALGCWATIVGVICIFLYHGSERHEAERAERDLVKVVRVPYDWAKDD